MIAYIILLVAACLTAYFLITKEPKKTKKGFNAIYWVSRIWFIPFYLLVFWALVSSGSLFLMFIAFLIAVWVIIGVFVFRPWQEVV